MKVLNLLFVFVLTLIESIAFRITGTRKVTSPMVPVSSSKPVALEVVTARAEQLTEAQKLMSGLATLKVNRSRLEPVQSAEARRVALQEAADRRARRALRRQGLTATM